MTGNFGQMMSSNGEIIQDYNNDKVQVSKVNQLTFLQQIRAELGEFEYDEQPNQTRGLDLEYRVLQTLENHAKYEG